MRPPIYLALVLASLLAPQHAKAVDIWLAGDPLVQAQQHKDQDYDYLRLFDKDAPWHRAERHVKVFKASMPWIQSASDESLTKMFAGLRERGILFAVETLMIPQATCGFGVEGYSAPGAVQKMAERVKRLGGELRYVAMDEPLSFGYHYRGKNACAMAIPEVAQAVAVSVRVLRSVFPDVVIGDIEPILNVPGWIDRMGDFAGAFHAATGAKLAFLHADIDWSHNPMWQAQLHRLMTMLRARGIGSGIIYNGDPTDQTDIEWMAKAEHRFTTIESDPDTVPNVAIIQTWDPYPTHMLPEYHPGTMTYLVTRYIDWDNFSRRHGTCSAVGRN